MRNYENRKYFQKFSHLSPYFHRKSAYFFPDHLAKYFIFLILKGSIKRHIMPGISPTKYAMERLLEREKQITTPGPVITISREYGCPSKLIAGLLADRINRGSTRKKWNWISKEILDESARKLGLTPREIKYIFDYKKRSFLEDLLISQEKKQYYHSEWAVRKAIGEVIRATAMEGHVIIVGRAGVALTRNIEASLHVRLTAPEAWRIAQVAKSHNITEDKAAKLIRELDKNRKQFLEYYLKKPFDLSLFDVIFNCSTLTKEKIAAAIYHIAGEKGFFRLYPGS